jgi:hypothetical protein
VDECKPLGSGSGGGGGGSGSRPATRSGEFGMKSAGPYVQYQQQQAGTNESCSPHHTLCVKASFVVLSAALMSHCEHHVLGSTCSGRQGTCPAR